VVAHRRLGLVFVPPLEVRVTDDSRTLLGRRPRDMRAFVEAHADDFRGDP